MILGVTGYIGAGKEEFVKILERKYEFVRIEFKDAIVREARRRGLDINDRLALQDLGKKVEEEEGGRVWAGRVMNGIGVRRYNNPTENYVVECFRTEQQVRAFREKYGDDFYLVAITADFDIRWGRVRERGKPGDPELLADFKLVDDRDRGRGVNPTQNTDWCVRKGANYILLNDHHYLPNFKRDVTIFMRDELKISKP